MDNRERADLREIAIQVLDDINGECGVGNETSVIYDEKGDYAGWAPEVIEAAEQAISRTLASALAQRDAWQPIETAPPNTTVLLFEPEVEGRAGSIITGMARWGWSTDTVSNWSENSWATHWMPLPASPSPSAETGNG
jgi:hypothetical protein